MSKKAYLSRERLCVNLSGAIPGLDAVLCRVNYSFAHRPLQQHVHEGSMEFVLVVKGEQVYTVGGCDYTVKSGELFFTLPNEPHSTAGYPEDKSLFYYMIVNMNQLEGLLGCGEPDGRAICQALLAMKPRVFKAVPSAPRMVDEMICCCLGESPFRSARLRNLLSSFVLDALESAGKSERGGRFVLSGVLDMIERNIETDLSIAVLAEFAGLSVSGFKASFREQTGIPPGEYVLRRKVEAARKMLEENGPSITDISYRLGFSSSQYFATVFKRYTSITPGEYRKRRQLKTGFS